MKNITILDKTKRDEFAILTGNPIRIFLIVLGLISVGCAVLIGLNDLILGAVSGLFGLTLLIAGIFMWKKTITRQAEKNNQKMFATSVISNSFTFNNEGFEIISLRDGEEFATAKHRYSDLTKVIESHKSLFLFVASAQAYVINKETMVEGNVEDLIALLKIKVPRYKSAI